MAFEGRGLACVRGERTVFDHVDFLLDNGAALVLRGPNGSGKSSLLRLAAGLLPTAAGALLWDGAPIAGAPEAHRARLTYVGHLDAVKPAFTVVENLSFWAAMSLHASATDEALADALSRFALQGLADIPARLLSAGERRRVALARLALSDAPLWLLDEPTAALDAAGSAALNALMVHHLARRGLIIVATHVDLGLAEATTLDLGAGAGAGRAGGSAP